MAFSLKRSDLQKIAQAKLDDALLLLAHQRFSNAYYLGGYAVEIGLKACIARQITAETIPDKNLVIDTYSHQLRKLVGVAGLSNELKMQEQQDPMFSANWALVAEWVPEIRYGPVDPLSAQLLLQAISDSSKGVFQWIKVHW